MAATQRDGNENEEPSSVRIPDPWDGMHSRVMTPEEWARLENELAKHPSPGPPGPTPFSRGREQVEPEWGPPSDAEGLGQETLEGIRGAEGEALRARYGLRASSTIPDGPPPPLLIDRLDPEGNTVLFGPGGVGKGALACHWITRLTEAGQVVLIVDYEDHPSEWARRVASLGGITEGVLYVSPSAGSWSGTQGAIWAQADELRAVADVVGATYIVIDSIVVACGATDPLDPGAAGQYAAALARIGRPALSLGHVTKAEDGRYPFGSVFWHNLARVTWGLAKGQGGAILTNRKANNYPNQGRQLVTVTWSDDRPASVWERSYTAKLAELITDALAERPLTVAEITTALEEDRDEDEPAIKADSVRHTLRRGLKADPRTFTVEGTGDRALWRNA